LPFDDLGDVVRELAGAGMRVSVDTFDLAEIRAAVSAGAEMVLSVNGSNVDVVRDLAGTDARVVAIPDFGGGLETLTPTLEALDRWSVSYLIDPILEPVGFGFMASLERYAEVRRRYPDAEMLMGIGNITELTAADANHNVSFSTDSQLYVNNYSRLDLPNTLELRKTSDNSTVATVERGDASELAKTGWQAPEVFTAKGRDGKTDIWGVIIRPTNFDPSKRYPVIENIYAGPQGSFVPKSFLPYSSMMAQAEIGFIVVQIDGMGTANRSKAFHDVAWKNLGDAGFPDRILWHKAVAAKYPWYDISRVGIYGGSAGGQNSLGGLLFHPDFYKVAVSYAGCHDNRMDKIWWNEQWMGWPIGPQYSASSNVDNAYRLQGELLLVVGEMDTNVDPSSTMQVVSKLIKANKNFDLLVVPGANHGAARGDRYATYGAHKQYDFFVRHLLGVNPPPWNKAAAAGATQSAR